MTKANNSTVEKAAQKLYEARVEQATAEYFDCLENRRDELGDELGIDQTCEMTYQEKLIAHYASLERALKAADDAEKTIQEQKSPQAKSRA